jgi:hypothetical protein
VRESQHDSVTEIDANEFIKLLSFENTEADTPAQSQVKSAAFAGDVLPPRAPSVDNGTNNISTSQHNEAAVPPPSDQSTTSEGGRRRGRQPKSTSTKLSNRKSAAQIPDDKANGMATLQQTDNIFTASLTDSITADALGPLTRRMHATLLNSIGVQPSVHSATPPTQSSKTPRTSTTRLSRSVTRTSEKALKPSEQITATEIGT